MKATFLPPTKPVRLLDLLTSGYEFPGMYFCRVTPDDAKEVLKGNKKNRTLKERRVARIADDIASGAWGIDGNSIALDNMGNVRNGQHRLRAIIQAGKTVDTFVYFGVLDAAVAIIDDVASRSVADNLTMAGIKNASLVASSLRLIVDHESGDMYRISMAAGGARSHSTGSLVREYHDKHQNLPEAASWATRLTVINRPLATMIYYLCEPSLKERFAAFCESADKGIGLSASDPELVIRARLITRNKTGSHLRRSEAMAITIKAWNLYACGRSARFIRWVQSGPQKEAFPRPILKESEIE